jgi:hypothetical protein
MQYRLVLYCRIANCYCSALLIKALQLLADTVNLNGFVHVHTVPAAVSDCYMRCSTAVKAW